MNHDPGMVHALYAKVHMKDGSNRLQELVNRVLERFQTGLLVKEWNSVKLHATVMNTLLRKGPNAEGRYISTERMANKSLRQENHLLAETF